MAGPGKFDQGLRHPQRSAKAMGYRMPAEFEPVEAVWLSYPENAETWPGCLPQAQRQYDDFMAQVARFARVELTQKHGWRSNDAWIRDYGPIFVIDGNGNLACHDFVFNGWGGKYNAEYDDDDLIPQWVAKLLDVPVWLHDLVLEGGSIDVNGRGTVMTTEQCLLNENRNPARSREEIENELHQALGTELCLWLPGGIIGDDTDGHIDDVARFVDPTTVVALRASADHPDYDVLDANFRVLEAARDQDGRKLTLVPLPVPEPVTYDFPPDRFGPGGLAPCPASYANFLVVDRAVLVPVFGQRSDDQALRVIEEACPEREIVPLRAEYLVIGLGGLHCLSQQQPRRSVRPV